ncbi:hypothetical protein [Pannonibacter phragmitetus]|uniref:hypothetical protein n=1 Tax=Pannonibacter phragmitetus TaxID=121719 RepID=UPI003D2F31AC
MTEETSISPQIHADVRPLTELDLACAAGTLLHSVRHPAALLTARGKFLLANQALLEELACSSALLTGRPLEAVINEQALRRLRPLIEMAARGKPAMAEGMFAFDEGRGAPMRLTCTPCAPPLCRARRNCCFWNCGSLLSSVRPSGACALPSRRRICWRGGC